jgi:hypothetical protein
MNRREGKKIAVMAAIITGFMVIAFMPFASAGVTSFTVTPDTGIAGAVQSYSAYVITDGVTSIDITIPAGFLAVAPTTSGVEIARADFFNSSTKAYYGHAIITAGAIPATQVDIDWELGGETATTTGIVVDYAPGKTNTFKSGFSCDKSSAIITLPTETKEGSITITIDCTECPCFNNTWRLDAVMIDIKQFVRNPLTAGDYVFSADGEDATVQITSTYGGGVYRNGMWVLRTANSPLATVYRFNYGNPSDVPFPGDWNNNGEDGIGLYRDGWWLLKNDKSAGVADYTCKYGNPSDEPVAGNWNGLRGDGIGVYRDGQWILRNYKSAGDADYRFNFGNPSDKPVTGDWNDNGEDGIGVYRNGWWILKNDKSAGDADYRFKYGNPSDKPVTGDWNDNGEDGIGVYRDGQWILRNDKSAGDADYRFNYGNPTDVPVPGSWS